MQYLTRRAEMDKYIVEDLQTSLRNYLKQNPRPDYRLVSVCTFESAFGGFDYELIWELKDPSRMIIKK